MGCCARTRPNKSESRPSLGSVQSQHLPNCSMSSGKFLWILMGMPLVACPKTYPILSANPKILVYTALRRDSDQEQSG